MLEPLLNVAVDLTGFWLLAREEALQALFQRIQLVDRLRGQLALAFKSLPEADRVHDSASLAHHVRSNPPRYSRPPAACVIPGKRSDSRLDARPSRHLVRIQKSALALDAVVGTVEGHHDKTR